MQKLQLFEPPFLQKLTPFFVWNSIDIPYEDLARAMDDRDRLRERQGNPRCYHNLMNTHTYIYIYILGLAEKFIDDIISAIDNLRRFRKIAKNFTCNCLQKIS